MSTIEDSKAKILKITKSGNKFFKEEVMSLPKLPTWPLGSQGSLTILNGETIQVLSGSVLDYSSIDIQAGGVLEITSEGSLKTTYIGCTGNIIINGEIRARSYIGGSASINETVQSTNENISFNLTQALGGSGGRTFDNTFGFLVPTSAGTNGFGGGGAGGSHRNPNLPIPFSFGYVGGSNNGSGTFGNAGGVTLGNGGDSSDISFQFSNDPNYTISRIGGVGGGSGGGSGNGSTTTQQNGSIITYSGVVSGGGAGGGYKGKHGLPIYIYCLGSITGSGLINLSGTNGFNGGNSKSTSPLARFGPFSPNYYSQGGASGGGGAGGSGGFLWVRHASGFSVPYSVNFGVGGSSGTHNALDINGVQCSDSQTAGSSGSVGGVDIQQI